MRPAFFHLSRGPPRGVQSFLEAAPVWIKQKIWIKQILQDELSFPGPMVFPEHHESHAASAFFPSPFDEAAVLTIDGVGEWTTTSLGQGEGNRIELLSELRFPHSLGLLYSAFTYYLGFRVNSGEYKVMGLAPYGEPRFRDLILAELVDLKDDGSFRLNLKHFDFLAGLRMTNQSFARLFGASRREPEAELTQHHMDIARSLQAVTEEVMLRLARHARAHRRAQSLPRGRRRPELRRQRPHPARGAVREYLDSARGGRCRRRARRRPGRVAPLP